MAFEFGDFVLDDRSYELRRAGEPLKLEPKVFDVLTYLVRHRERVHAALRRTDSWAD